MFESLVKKYSNAEIKSGIATITDSVRRSNSKIGWLRCMAPVWQANLQTLTREARRRQIA